jgi:hypothetical protein
MIISGSTESRISCFIILSSPPEFYGCRETYLEAMAYANIFIYNRFFRQNQFDSHGQISRKNAQGPKKRGNRVQEMESRW